MILIVLIFMISIVVFADTTKRLGLGLMDYNEAQPNITFNNLVNNLDVLISPILSNYPASASPDVEAATNGNIYIVPSSPEGDWVSHTNDLAVMQNNAWIFITPIRGMEVIYSATDSFVRIIYDGTSWINIFRGGEFYSEYESTEPNPLIFYGARRGNDTYFLSGINSSGESYLTINSLGNIVNGISNLSGSIFSDSNGSWIQFQNRAADIPEVPAGSFAIWMSNGTGSGDAGDIMAEVNVAGVTKVITLIDFSTY